MKSNLNPNQWNFINDFPELEAFLAAIEKDVRNPELRKKVKSNLNPNQMNFINDLFKTRGRCDVCCHMVETSRVYSYYFKRTFANLPAAKKDKYTWFVYVFEEDA